MDIHGTNFEGVLKMKTKKSSLTNHAHLVILAVTLVVAILGWKEYLPVANRTYSLTWVDYSPMNSSNAIIDADRASTPEQTLVARLEDLDGYVR